MGAGAAISYGPHKQIALAIISYFLDLLDKQLVNLIWCVCGGVVIKTRRSAFLAFEIRTRSSVIFPAGVFNFCTFGAWRYFSSGERSPILL